ncbi:MAG: hypothetical protein PVS3B3_08940 [Ktedonobacteraceae bacterium]
MREIIEEEQRAMQGEGASGQEESLVLTVEEMAERLGVTAGRVKHMIKAGRFPSARKASSHEAVMLLEAKRVKTIPHAGVLVIQEGDVTLVEQRNRKGGRPQKKTQEKGEVQGMLPWLEESNSTDRPRVANGEERSAEEQASQVQVSHSADLLPVSLPTSLAQQDQRDELGDKLEEEEEQEEGGGEKKGLRRYYSKYQERPTAYYDPLSGQLYSEKSRVHRLESAGLDAVLEVCDCPVLYLLPDASGEYPTASDYYSIEGIEVRKYLEKRQAAMVRYQGKMINVYPLSTWCDVGGGASLKGVIRGMRTIQQELEQAFQPQKVTAGRVEKFRIPLLATPSQMGADLLKRSLPYEQVYEPLPEQTALTILQELGQGRIETFYHGRDEVEQVYAYDGRWMYASCLRHVPVGPVVHDMQGEIAAYVPGFYRVEVQIPVQWQHIGLLPMRNEVGNSQKFSYPRMAGQTFESWCSSSELSLALKQGWSVVVKERILWPQTHRLPEPLKLWGDRLIGLRMERAKGYEEPIRGMLEAAVRNILLHTIGGFHRVTREFDGYTSDVMTIPATATSFELLPDGEIWRYTLADTLSPLQQMLSQPHWAASIWGAARKKLAEQALQVSFEDLIAMRVDAVWTAREMPWKDTGKVGVFRRERLQHDMHIRWPRNTGEMVHLVQRTKGQEA